MTIYSFEAIKLNGDLESRHIIDEKIIYRRRLMKLAFAMNLLGVNSLSQLELYSLFPNLTEYNCFKFISFIVIDDGRISFQHNILQEYFSALVLAESSFEQIRNCITFPPTLEKLKPKWLNTIGILLEHLDSKSMAFKRLLDLVCKEEPQLLLTLEYNHFDTGLRFKIFQTILRQPNRVFGRDAYYNSALVQLGGIVISPEPIDFLLDEVKKVDSPIRAECLFYLQFADKDHLFGYRWAIIQVTTDVLLEADTYMQELAVDVLIQLKINVSQLVKLLTEELSTLHHFRLRDKIYQYLNQSVEADDYVDFYLEGFRIHDEYVKQDFTTYVGLGSGLMDGLEAMRKSAALHKVLDFFINNVQLLDEHESPVNRGVVTEKHFLSTFSERLSEGYNEDHSLFNKVLALYRKLGEQAEHYLIEMLSSFFWLTNTHRQAFFELLNSDASKEVIFWGLSKVASEETVLAFIPKYRSQEIDTNKVWDVIGSLNYAGRGELSEKFRLAINELGLGSFEYPTDWIEAQQARRRMDLSLMLDQRAFLAKVEEIFNEYNTIELTKDQIWEYRRTWQTIDNQVAVSYLNKWCHHSNTVQKEKALSYLRDETNWGEYSIGLLLNEFRNSKDLSQTHRDKVINWCLQELPKANFLNAITQHPNSTWTFRPLESRIAEFYLLLNFDLDEKTLLDMLSFDAHGFIVSRSQKDNISLSKKIIDTISDTSKVKHRIFQNLKDGIKIIPVLHNHIDLCSQLKIKEALPQIRFVLEDADNQKAYQLDHSLKVYLALGGSLHDLVFVLDRFDPDNDFHWTLLERFVETDIYYKPVGQLLLRAIEAGMIIWQQPRVIRLLIIAGFIEGLQYFARTIKATNKIPEDYRWIQTVKALPGMEAAIILHDLLLYSLTHSIQGDRFHEAIELITGYFREIALLQEDTYQYVYNALAKLANDHEDHEKCFYLKSSLFNLEKEYYLQKTDYSAIAEVKPVVAAYVL